MVEICRYFQRGTCNYGRNCRYIHPGQPTMAGPGVTGGGVQTTLGSGFTMPSAEGMRIDMTEPPLWKFSSYGPGKDPPIQLIDDADISPEEMRLKFYINQQAHQQEWDARMQRAQQQISAILNDIPGALNYLTEAEKNRAQVYKYGGKPSGQPMQSTTTPNPFGTANNPSASSAPNPFGQPSQPAFGQSSFGQPRPSPFASATSAAPSPFATAASSTPAFGQSSFGSGGALNKPSGFGQPAFGQSGFGSTPATSAPAFGQSSFGAPKPAFGQSAFGQSSFGQPQGQASSSPFGALGTQAPQGGSVFGQGSSLGANAPKSAFGQSSFGQPSGFGQASNAAAPSPFAAVGQQQQQQQQQQQTANPFGQPSQPTSAPNPFAASQPGPSPFAQAAQQQQPQQQQSVNPFGQPSQATTTGNPFGAPNTAAAPAASINPFASTTSNPVPATPARNAFGVPSASAAVPLQPAAPTTSAFSQPQQSSLAGQNGGLFAGGFASPDEVIKKVGAAAGGKWDDPRFEYTNEELEAFKMPAFMLGKVPLVPPPMEMCTI